MIVSMPETAEQVELLREERQPMRAHKVKQANQLTVARYLLGEQEQKLLLYAISMIDPQAKQFARYRIEISSYAAACGISGHAINEQLWDAAKAIATKPLIILNHREADGKMVDLITHWFAETKRTPGYIEVTFPPSLAGYLVDVQQRFFRYELGVPLRFKGEYAIRLYQWLKSWQFRGSKEISLPDLRVVLGLVEWDADGNVKKERLPAFADVKKWALVPSLAQINKSSDVSVGMREVKKQGTKRVESVVFTIVDNPKYIPDPTVPRLPGVRVAPPVDPAASALVASLQAEFGLSPEQARIVVGRYPVASIKEKAAIVRGGSFDSAASALLKALEKNWQPRKTIGKKLAKKPTTKTATPAPEPPVAPPLTPEEQETGAARFLALKAKLKGGPKKADLADQGQADPVPAAAAVEAGDELPF